MGIESDYMPGEWKWIFDPTTPSVRTLLAAYDPPTTPTSVCDMFFISPNIESVSVKCYHLGFTNSDHNPVIIQVKLKLIQKVLFQTVINYSKISCILIKMSIPLPNSNLAI